MVLEKRYVRYLKIHLLTPFKKQYNYYEYDQLSISKPSEPTSEKGF